MSLRFSFNLDDSKQDLTEMMLDGGIGDISTELDQDIDTVNQEIQESISFYSLLQRQLSDTRQSHQTELDKLRNEIEETRQDILEQLELQEESQSHAEKELEESSKRVLERISQSKNSIEVTEQPQLSSELKKVAEKEEELELEEQLHKLQLDEMRDKYTFVMPQENPTKQDLIQAEIELVNLKKAIQETRKKNRDTVQTLTLANENEKINHQLAIEKLQKTFENREKEQLHHLANAQKLLETEKHYAEIEEAGLDRQITTLRGVRERLKKECSRRVKEALDEMRKASAALDRASEKEDSNRSLLDTKSSMNCAESLTLSQMRVRESQLQQEIDQINRKNESAYRCLQKNTRDSDIDVLEGLDSDSFKM